MSSYQLNTCQTLFNIVDLFGIPIKYEIFIRLALRSWWCISHIHPHWGPNNAWPHHTQRMPIKRTGKCQTIRINDFQIRVHFWVRHTLKYLEISAHFELQGTLLVVGLDDVAVAPECNGKCNVVLGGQMLIFDCRSKSTHLTWFPARLYLGGRQLRLPRGDCCRQSSDFPNKHPLYNSISLTHYTRFVYQA